MIYRIFFVLIFISLFHFSCQKTSKVIFSKKVSVFDVEILASSTTSDDKILHAAKILAQYLDNDENGQVDNVLVHKMLLSRKATLLMLKDEREADNLWMSGENDFPVNSQLLFDDETIPSFNSNTSNQRFDASLEEILHLVTHEGYSLVYPELKEQKGSSLAVAMDVARGGFFSSPPEVYPSSAWYSYDDLTCSYGCMIAEYFYWVLTSILGAQSYPGRLNEIGHEWSLNSKEKVMSKDILAYSLMTNSNFNLPKVLPDSEYLGFEIVLNDK